MDINIYLHFQGQATKALAYYEDVFGNRPSRVEKFSGMPPNPAFAPMPEEYKHLIAYSEIEILGTKVMISDTFPDMPFNEGTNFSILVQSENQTLLTEYYDKLASEGEVIMEMGETHWSPSYGSLLDKFNVRWQFSAYRK